MTPWKKRNHWIKLRKYQESMAVILGHKMHGELSKLLFRGYTRIISAKIEFYMTFQRMLREAQTGKQVRQAYRYAIDAGIYKSKAGQFQKRYREPVTIEKWLTKHMRTENERTD